MRILRLALMHQKVPVTLQSIYSALEIRSEYVGRTLIRVSGAVSASVAAGLWAVGHACLPLPE